MTRSSLPHARGALAAAVALAFCACDDSSSAPGSRVSDEPGRVTLQSMQYGRLVDLYAYRVVDGSGSRQRSAVTNREPVLIERNVVVGPGINTEALFDASGEVRNDADFRFLPFDVSTGHEELLILWDDTDAVEGDRFQAALSQARSGLVPIADAFRGQPTNQAPIPVVPRNAAIVLNFNNDVGVDESFFQTNQGAVQLLEFRSDPALNDPAGSFSPLTVRVVPKGRTLILDTTVIGGEVQGLSTNGMPSSLDQVTANVRIALPSRGALSEAFFVENDTVDNYNSIDSRGRASVVRDFRTGNEADGRMATVADQSRPQIVADQEMGIVAIDAANKVLTINKRVSQTVIRGRIPFVDGATGPSGLPQGPGTAPGGKALFHGDLIQQQVTDPLSGDTFTVRAEILENLELGSAADDPNLGLSDAGDAGDMLTQVRVRVANLTTVDEANGREWSFQASTLPLGEECSVRSYYVHSLSINGVETGDSMRVEQFLVVEPEPPTLINGQPVAAGTRIDPLSTYALRFSEPMDLESVDSLGNFCLSNSFLTGNDVAEVIQEPKAASITIQPARLFDVNRDGSLLRLVPPVGLFHESGVEEQYWLHLLLGGDGPRDLGGNQVAILDDPTNPAGNFSIPFQMDRDGDENLVGGRVFRFEAADEDGTVPGSNDFYGQFLLQNGRIEGAPAVRFSRTADDQNLGGIVRGPNGECMISPAPAATCATGAWTASGTFARYQTPGMPAAGTVEPHQPQGARMQMVYLEDDFDLGYKAASSFMLDVEQMYWSTFGDAEVLFDQFDRYSLSLGHAEKRPDLYVFDVGAGCTLSAEGQRSGLFTRFADNVLRGTTLVEVFRDEPYAISPADAFRAESGARYLPYPRFQRSFTWRDERLVSWDMASDAAVGLGGAQDPGAPQPTNDFTAPVDSPWCPDSPGWTDPTQAGPPPEADCYPLGSLYVVDIADFRGDRQRDHNPIALPLLLDWSMHPDDPGNGLAHGANLMQMAMVGPNPQGWYDNAFVGPWTRVYSIGGRNPLTQLFEPVDPSAEAEAQGGFINDPILGQVRTPNAGDSMIAWAQADFVRKVSAVTFGFFDTLRPNQHALDANEIPALASWGFPPFEGFPDLDEVGGPGIPLGVSDVVAFTDPPINQQPAGTRVTLELRGAASFDNPMLYDPLEPVTGDLYNQRGNLLNPNYACEAYRYAMAAPGVGPAEGTPRVSATGLTPYVLPEDLNQVRDPQGLLPRYLNLRVILENNTAVTPAVAPFLDGMAISYRIARR